MKCKVGCIWVVALVMWGGAIAAQNAALAPVEDDPDLPRVLLIKDSISIGYTLPVRERLRGIANVHRIPANGGPTTRGLTNLDAWLGDGEWDVIHFNWGLHDLKFMEDGKRQVGYGEYEENLDRLVKRLQGTGARLIWASTTPVPEGNLRPLRKAGDAAAYNIAARRIMEAHGIPIDDLYVHAMPRLAEIQIPENVHFTAAGYQFLAEKVAASIRHVLSSQPPIP